MPDDCKFLGEDKANYGPRAVAAYFKTEHMPDQPGSYDLWEYKGKKYIVLGGGRANDAGFLAMYRIKNDGVLRRLKRFPACLVEAYKKK